MFCFDLNKGSEVLKRLVERQIKRGYNDEMIESELKSFDDKNVLPEAVFTCIDNSCSLDAIETVCDVVTKAGHSLKDVEFWDEKEQVLVPLMEYAKRRNFAYMETLEEYLEGPVEDPYADDMHMMNSIPIDYPEAHFDAVINEREALMAECQFEVFKSLALQADK